MTRGFIRMIQGTALTAMAATMFAMPTVSHAQEEAAPINSGAFTFSAGFDVSTHYFFRGVLQEDQGLIVQPWADISVEVYPGDDGDSVTGVGLSVGTWNSFHSEQTGAAGAGPDTIYETDYYIGAGATLFDDWEAGITYTALTSPNGAFATVEEIGITVGYDDSDLWASTVEGTSFEGLALSPYVTVVFELSNSTAGTDEGIYGEIGIEPSFAVYESEDYPLTLSVPVAIGMSLDGYYQNFSDQANGAAAADGDFFGFVSAGGVLSMPLTFIPEKYGAWEGYVGVTVLFLGEDLETVNNGDSYEVIGTLGVGMKY